MRDVLKYFVDGSGVKSEITMASALNTGRGLTKLEPWSVGGCTNSGQPDGPGVKHLARIASRPVTWVIKIKHAGLGVLGQSFKRQAASAKPQASSSKQQA